MTKHQQTEKKPNTNTIENNNIQLGQLGGSGGWCKKKKKKQMKHKIHNV